MLPVVAGAAETRRQILLYSLLLAPVGALPWLFGYAGLALWRSPRIAGGALMVALRPGSCYQAPRGADRRSSCSPSPSSISSCCSRCCWSSRASALSMSAAVRPRVRMSCGNGPASTNEPGIVLTAEQKRRRRARSIAIAVSLGVLVLLVYRRHHRQARARRARSVRCDRRPKSHHDRASRQRRSAAATRSSPRLAACSSP